MTGLQRHKPWIPTPEQVDRYHSRQRERRHAAALAALQRRSTVPQQAPQIRTGEPAERNKPRRRPTQGGESRARRLVRKRSGGLCEIRIPDRCTWWATEWSHRIRRSQGGPWTPSNGLAACHWCHLEITHATGPKAAEYRRNGWTLSSTQNPLTEPALTIHGLVLLDDEGDWRLDDTATPKGAAA